MKKKKKENSTDDCLAERQQQQQKALTASNVFSNSLRARMTAPPWLRCSSFLFSNLSYVSNAIYLLFLLSIGQCCMSRSQTQYIKKKKKEKRTGDYQNAGQKAHYFVKFVFPIA